MTGQFIQRVSRTVVFRQAGDYRDFIELLKEGSQRRNVPIDTFCLTPNSVNLLVEIRDMFAVDRFLQWVFATHAKRYQAKYDTEGSLWRGRVHRVPIQISAVRSEVRQALARLPYRYRLLDAHQRWPWTYVGGQILNDVAIGTSVDEWKIRYLDHCVDQGIPMGSMDWLNRVSPVAAVDDPPRRRGRPRKQMGDTGLHFDSRF